MDFAAIERILINYGVPLFVLVFILWGMFSGARYVVRMFEPYIKEWFEGERKLRQKTIESIQTNQQVNLAQTPILQDTNSIVHGIDARQLDPKSMISNVHTLEQLAHLKRNHKTFAHAAIVSIEALVEIYPDTEHKLAGALRTLREVEGSE